MSKKPQTFGLSEIKQPPTTVK